MVCSIIKCVWLLCTYLASGCLAMTDIQQESSCNSEKPIQDFNHRLLRPHILLILADDYGWNDVGYHGSEIRTPTLDELSAHGVRLENHYVYPSCSPTRSALMTGRYTIHTGFQHFVNAHGNSRDLPLDHPTLAEQLRKLGYATHMVGKWHVGYTTWKNTPTGRGFQSHLGIYQGLTDYYNHSNCQIQDFNTTALCGYDFFHDRQVDWSAYGHYATDLYKDQVARILLAHDQEQPLFLYVAFQLPHTPLQVPHQHVKDYQFIKDRKRKIYAGMVSYMDNTVADIKTMFEERDMWEDTLVIFASDNGGAREWGADNYPLRGGKGDNWQGGIRGVAFVHGYNIDTPAATSDALLHITDWYPTLVHLAGGSTENIQLDGHDIWQTISQGASSPRKEVLVNIDPLAPLLGKPLHRNTFDTRVKAVIIHGKWKLMTGQRDTPGPLPGYVGKASVDTMYLPDPTTEKCPTVLCEDPCTNVWLVDLDLDPAEEHNLAHILPDMVHYLLERLAFYNSTAVLPQDPSFDPRASPFFHNGAWAPWL